MYCKAKHEIDRAANNSRFDLKKEEKKERRLKICFPDC